MSATLTRLRKRAAELEQKKQFDKALEVYVQILDEGGKDLDDEDVPLFNRVGDMLMRKGSVTEALGYYERAVDMYAERGYLNNAIALCSKILRQSPGRAAVYYKLARISAKKGFKSDARKNFLEYADRMQKLGMAEEAFRALKEFASLYPDQDDVRLVLAELLSKENRKGEALEQLQALYEKLQSEGRSAEARATVDRMRAIDPNVTPREATQTRQVAAAGDLVFLDLSDGEEEGSKNGTSGPASARAPVPTPVPALTGLSITFIPNDAEPTPHPEGFESTAVESEPVETAPVNRALTPLGGELVIEPSEAEPSMPDDEAIVPLDALGEAVAAEPARVEPAMLDDLLPDMIAPPAPPARPQTPRHNTPMSGLEFADLELDDAPREAPQRKHDLSLPGDLPDTPDEVAAVPAPSPGSDAAAEDARAAAAEAADLKADMAAREAALLGKNAPPLPISTRPVPEPVEEDFDSLPDPVEELAPYAPADETNEAPVARAGEDIPDDFMAMPAGFGGPVVNEEESDHAFPPLPGLDESAAFVERAEIEQAEADELAAAGEPRAPTPRVTVSIGSAEAHLRRRLELEPENWELRRQLGEALLDTGDRDGGLYELELAMVGFELLGDMDRAQEVVDEILGVFPASVAHHQKRVEYAVRSRDRVRLTNSYLELADALFRTGAGDKAVAVYGRVLELDAGNERAEFALATLAPDELIRMRGVPARPDRWTEELDAIGGSAAPEGDAPSGEVPSTDSREAPDAEVEAAGAKVPELEVPEAEVPEAEVAHAEVAEQQASVEEAKFDALEIPDPDWGEGVPTPASVSASEPADFLRGVDDLIVEEEPAPEAQEESTDDSLPLESLGAKATPLHLDTVSSKAPDEEPAPRVPTPRAVTPPVAAPRVPSPARAARVSTPRSSTPIEVVKTVARRLTPAGAADSEYVDLGEWLRHTEPTRSTRMQVEDPKPTGDEQADFEELLRRFKRGVAENVEAEDYEAHYDLGVAYKEMGLVDEAIAQFQKSLRGASHRVRSYEALGQCFVEKEQYPIAAALLQRATEVPGSDDQLLVGVLYLLGFATEHMGRPAEALPYYLRVFAVDIEFRDIAARVAALGNLAK
jgi:tetratricopeptide (TPR) repeat protein